MVAGLAVKLRNYSGERERAMEPKHKELLDQCHQNLLESITDADRVIELLIVSGTLSQLDRFELDQNCSSSAEKVDHLLKMLMSKESDHFLDLCVALEKAYPDLYPALFSSTGGGPVDHSTGKNRALGMHPPRPLGCTPPPRAPWVLLGAGGAGSVWVVCVWKAPQYHGFIIP